jgi:DNA-binding NarL/FixJ family response regulator
LATPLDVTITAATPALLAGLTALLRDPRLRLLGGSDPDHPPDALSPTTHVIADDARLIGLARDIAESSQGASVVALTELAAAVPTLSSLNFHGWAVLPSDVPGDDLVMAVILASRGSVVIPAREAASFSRTAAARETNPLEPLRDPLTPREQEVLELLVRGLPNKIIAQRLEISESTVKYHVSSIYVKLGAASRADAVSRAARAGLVTL